MVSDVSVSDGLRFASSPKIETEIIKFYKNVKDKYDGKMTCVNAGCDMSGGERTKTLPHSNDSLKVADGTNQYGTAEPTAVPSDMIFQDDTPESRVTLQEAQILRDVFLKRGFSVFTIREGSDMQFNNIAHTMLTNNYTACHIAVHWDSTSSDRDVYFTSIPDGPKKMDPVFSTWRESEAFGEAPIGGSCGKGVKIFDGGSIDADPTQTSYPTVSSVDIELGNRVPDYSEATLRKFAEGSADGVTRYFTK